MEVVFNSIRWLWSYGRFLLIQEFGRDSWGEVFVKVIFYTTALLVVFVHTIRLAQALLKPPRITKPPQPELIQPKRRESISAIRWCLWVFPLLCLCLFQADVVRSVKDVLLVSTSESDALSRELRWQHRLHNGALLLKNGTMIFENNTRIFYNGTILFPNGTFQHKIQLHYFDYAESQAYLYESKLPHCGMQSETMFRSVGMPVPMYLPADEESLAEVVRDIVDRGCKVKQVNVATVDALDNETVAVSLARMSMKIETWKLSEHSFLETSKQRNPTVRVEGGKTLAQLYSVIRPHGYFLPTHPSSWAYSIAELVTLDVYGGGFGEDSVASYITRLLVMPANGTLVELSHYDDIHLWRGSQGLLGVVVAAEFSVVQRPNFMMGYRAYTFSHWNKWVLDEVISHLLPGTIGAHYMYDASADKVLGVGYVEARVAITEADCSWSLARLSCSEHCQFEFRLGDFLPRHSCRLKNQYKDQNTHNVTRHFYESLSEPFFQQLAHSGINSGIQIQNQVSGIVARAAHTLMDTVSRRKGSLDSVISHTDFAKQTFNDGFWDVRGSEMMWMQYCFPLDSIFLALDVYRQYIHELEASKEVGQLHNLIDYPLQFHFFTLKHKDYLTPSQVAGHYVALLVQTSSTYDAVFTELEHRWQHIPNSFPDRGGIFGFNKNNTAFSNHTDYRFPLHVQQKFLKRRRLFDPDGHFWTGKASILFDESEVSKTSTASFLAYQHTTFLLALCCQLLIS